MANHGYLTDKELARLLINELSIDCLKKYTGLNIVVEAREQLNDWLSSGELNPQDITDMFLTDIPLGDNT